MRILFLLIAIPLLAVIGAFAAANTTETTVNFWPLPITVSAPVYALVLGPFFLGLILALIGTGLASVPVRISRWRHERRERALETETRRLKQALAEARTDAAETPESARTEARHLIGHRR